MIPGVNPKQMQQMMRQLGIQQVELPATYVIIKLEGNKELHIENPQVSKVNMMSQTTYQIVGNATEYESTPKSQEIEISQEDIKTVMEQTGASQEDAKNALTETEGDLALAILNLQK